MIHGGNMKLKQQLLIYLSIVLIYHCLCRDWKFKHPKRKTYSIRHAKVGKNSLFSKEVLYTLFLTNFISLLLGTGVG
jgi:hypothetical protein